jgi:hypothetical protein
MATLVGRPNRFPMIPTWVNPVRHLEGHSDIDCDDCGRHDEPAAALIVMQAHEASRAASLIKRRLVFRLESSQNLSTTFASILDQGQMISIMSV